MNQFLIAIAMVVALNAIACLYRLVRGPTAQDRLLAVNMFDTKALVVLLLTFFVIDEPALYLDVALLYALLNFVITVTVSRFLETPHPPRPLGCGEDVSREGSAGEIPAGQRAAGSGRGGAHG